MDFQITPSVLQLSAEQLHFDPDVNEFERDVAVLMLKDPQLTYTGETMHRQKVKTPPVNKTTEAKSKKSIRKNVEAPKLKGSEEMEKEVIKTSEQKQSPVKGNDSKRGVQEAPPEEEKNPNKTKFKPPANIAKADAKDPAYETLQGIGNELFNGPKAEKSKEDKEKSKDKQEEQPTAEKQKFKQPVKIQKADAKDPQYETLADVKDDIFKG
ncbi:hypothetical protein OESDEN_02733 [Oesophagostomum dentatum]|uniref:Uncharacterized protein n=1 Tax=Oesophagostomum dentatum TaxID=61180 RepID=A0A0B1TIB1_OESDE|nr:hypothetical protein OESDEN_02733 [Oesophagostomum dentatum]